MLTLESLLKTLRHMASYGERGTAERDKVAQKREPDDPLSFIGTAEEKLRDG